MPFSFLFKTYCFQQGKFASISSVTTIFSHHISAYIGYRVSSPFYSIFVLTFLHQELNIWTHAVLAKEKSSSGRHGAMPLITGRRPSSSSGEGQATEATPCSVFGITDGLPHAETDAGVWGQKDGQEMFSRYTVDLDVYHLQVK